jgi:hypothetical protein
MKKSEWKKLKKFSGRRVWDMGFASTMLWIQMGKRVTVYEPVFDEYKILGSLAIHLQCPWRIILEDKVFFGSSDISKLSAEIVQDYLQQVLELTKHSVVSGRIDFSDFGVFKLFFSESSFLEVFPVSMTSNENWRFMDNISDIHYVYTLKNGLET